MENKNKSNNTEKSKDDINFQLYFNMMKNDEMPWKLFIQIMNDMINLLNLAKSKKLIFDLLEKIKGFNQI